MVAAASALDFSAPVINESIINKVNSMESTWVAGVSPRCVSTLSDVRVGLRNGRVSVFHIPPPCKQMFVNATVADIQVLLGAVLSTHEGSTHFDHAVRQDHTYGLVAVPDSFDSTTDFPGCEDLIAHVRDQSSCGSCWAFGSTEAFNDRRCVAYGDKQWYAAEDTLACCSGIRCGLSMGCNGGQPTSAWKWFAATGVTSGGDSDVEKGSTCNPYPFEACAHHVDSDTYPDCPSDEYSTPKCTESCIDDGFKTAYADDKVKAKSSFTIRNEADMMEEVRNCE
ncbi:hypothetical protein TL16_g05071 [Triparma laevis f. inornata]|uniref:Peptidase C1A papain C-terminal domain-containing protein n=1 Tax=Triparma laevis f. inornata TaxID=1714386 RepID=A0A9W7AJU4_9STRA|nr:hypothetical protein TL16_g05071 [Triparma laevis f. inornata]